MTRINLVDPKELTDQHLFAEFREIKMVPKSLNRSLKAAWQREFDKNDMSDFDSERTQLAIANVQKRIPLNFTLNTGHVSFFYDKGMFLNKRYEALKTELRKRGVAFNESSVFDPENLMLTYPVFWNDYQPTKNALKIIRTRILEKIKLKPEWYKYYGRQIETMQYPFANEA